MLRREGADPFISEKFYSAVVQAVLLLGVETRVMTVEMSQKFEVVHLGFLRQVMGKKMRTIGENSWWKEAADSIFQAAVTQPLKTYLDKSQAKVAKWVALRDIFELCMKETGYREGGAPGAVAVTGRS